MSYKISNQGGCACGKVRYKTIGKEEFASVCHCRYCQLRTGSAFGISVYFKSDEVEILSGCLKKFEYTTESGNSVTTQFCVECGTSVFWNANIFKGMTGIGGGTFDPPTFWYKIKREVFCRSKAYFSKNEINTKFETSPTFTKMKDDPPRKRGV